MIGVITGTNSYLIKQEIQKIKSDFIKQYGEAGIDYLYADQIDTEILGSSLINVSLFTTNKLVIIKNISKYQALNEYFLKIVPQIPDEIQVILLEENIDKRTAFYKVLKKSFSILSFDLLSEQELTKWIVQKVKDEGGSIISSDAQKLISFIGVDQMRLASEIQKLITYQSDITEATIQKLVDRQPEETVFQLLDASMSGRTGWSIGLLSDLERAHEDPYAIANMIIWQSHILSVVASANNMTDSDISKQTKINPYVIQKTKRLSRGISANNLSNIIELVADMDIKLKTTTANPWRIIENTISNFNH
jgi:DNA polymerase-3 subunit delta